MVASMAENPKTETAVANSHGTGMELEEYGGISGSGKGRTVTAIAAPVKVMAAFPPRRSPWLASPSSPSRASLSDTER
ncbi:uncharacterized protein DS421_14g465150 [Arachis hypogaea]|nr:uncharacterized protein DS421_14g465150 [Arachis hypogaea]